MPRRITGLDASALNYCARYNCAPPSEWRPYLTKHVARMLYSYEARKKSRTLKAIRKVAEKNAEEFACRIVKR